MPKPRDRSPASSGAAAAALVAVALAPSDARADFDFQLGATLAGGWLRRTPTLQAEGASTSARELGAGALQTTGGLALLGFTGDLEMVVDDRYRIPLFGGGAYGAIGSSDAVVTGYDGSIARIRPWSMTRVDVFFPGVGYRLKHRRNMAGIAVRTGYSFVQVGGSVAAGAASVPLELGAGTLLVQLELEGCRRLDPTTRVCVQVAPRVYEHELLNGLTVGLRVEWGR